MKQALKFVIFPICYAWQITAASDSGRPYPKWAHVLFTAFVSSVTYLTLFAIYRGYASFF